MSKKARAAVNNGDEDGGHDRLGKLCDSRSSLSIDSEKDKRLGFGI